MKNSLDVCILGGGLAGLTLSLQLKQANPKISILVPIFLTFSIGLNCLLKTKKRYNNSEWLSDIHYGLFYIPLIAIILLGFWVSTRFFNSEDPNIYADLIL